MDAPSSELDEMSIEEVEIYAIDTPTALAPMDGAMPDCYQSQAEAFNGERAITTLPDLRESDDFRIDLDPSKPFPKPSRPYHMNQEEQAEC